MVLALLVRSLLSGCVETVFAREAQRFFRLLSPDIKIWLCRFAVPQCYGGLRFTKYCSSRQFPFAARLWKKFHCFSALRAAYRASFCKLEL
jgi:hypothetical protein